MKMLPALLLAAVCTLPIPQAEYNAAHADWSAQPTEEQPYVRYLTLGATPEQYLPTWEAALKFQVPSASRAINLDHQVPQRLGKLPIYRINLRSLQWDYNDWLEVLKKYPYSKTVNPLIIRGDWLVYALADTRDFDAYYRLLYGGKNIPKTDDDFLKFWGVNVKEQLGQSFGWVETKSQVAKQNSRFIEHFNGRGYSVWRTKDVFKVEKESDPLEELEGNFKHNGREFIAQFPKVGYGIRGAAQAYGLANGDGKVVNEAPVRLVEDYKRTLSQTAIVNNSSCTTCHEHGMNLPGENGLKAIIKAGVELKTYDKDKQELIEAFHLGDVGKQLGRNNEDYQAFVKACNGLTGPENAEAYRWCLSDYVDEVDMLRASYELYTTEEEFQHALAYASDKGIKVGARLAGLAHGRQVPRPTFEQEYYNAQQYLEAWNAK